MGCQLLASSYIGRAMDTAINTWEDDGGAVLPFHEPETKSKSESLKMWTALHNAFDYFNQELFEGRLNANDVILNCSRKNRTLGFFAPPSIGWKSGEGNRAEISLNPDYMGGRTLDEIYSTFVHEMTHFEQEVFGRPGRRGYHNMEWARMMKKVGLQPFNIKDPKKETGMCCSHRIIEDGVFQEAMNNLPDNCKFPIRGVKRRKQSQGGYVKWECPECGAIARATKNAQLTCTPCGVPFQRG